MTETESAGPGRMKLRSNGKEPTSTEPNTGMEDPDVTLATMETTNLCG